MSCPSNTMRPALGATNPLSGVDTGGLPAPLAPINARSSPGAIDIDTPLTARRLPKQHDSSSTRNRLIELGGKNHVGHSPPPPPQGERGERPTAQIMWAPHPRPSPQGKRGSHIRAHWSSSVLQQAQDP